MSLMTQLKAQLPAKNKITDPQEIESTYRHWRIRMMVSMFIGYAVFYFVRKNLSASAPALMQEFSMTKTQLGSIWSVMYLIYGFGKFSNGIIGDKANLRYFMAIGLLLSAFTNILFGMSSSIALFALFWAMNGYFQSMGWPPCARGLTQWYSKKERGTYWGIWNASHQVGAAGVLVLAGWLTTHYGWRMSFYVPAAIAIVAAVFLIFNLRDTPESLGLPEIEEFKRQQDGDNTEDLVVEEAHPEKSSWKDVLRNKEVWFLAIGNFFVYIVRYGAMDWAPAFLVEVKQATIQAASIKVAGFELTGILGALLAGYLSDRYFRKNRGPLNFIYMLLLIFAIAVFWLNPPGNEMVDFLALSMLGFLVYGPQMLVGVCAADTVEKNQAGTATGFTGMFGYLGGIVSGIGAGWILDNYGWDGGFIFFIACAAIGALCFLIYKPEVIHEEA